MGSLSNNDKAMVSFFDQIPEWNGVKFRFRGSDGYCEVSSLNKAMKGKRFDNWARSNFAKTVIEEISSLTGIPIRSEGGSSDLRTPLIDYDRSTGGGIWIHPYLVSAYALQDPKLYARVSIWLGNLMYLGTVNPHILEWTREEYERGVGYNREDIQDIGCQVTYQS